MATPYTMRDMKGMIARLPMTDENYYIFEALLQLPYDIYRPLIEMLCEGRIYVNDLVLQAKNNNLRQFLNHFDIVTNANSIGAIETTEARLKERLDQLAISGTRPSSVVVTNDTSSMNIDEDGNFVPIYFPESSSVIGADSNMIAPNPIQIARSGNLQDAQKAVQEDLGAALYKGIK